MQFNRRRKPNLQWNSQLQMYRRFGVKSRRTMCSTTGLLLVKKLKRSFIKFSHLKKQQFLSSTAQTCPINEVYSECKGDSACENTCFEPKRRLTCPHLQCRRGCTCFQNLVRDNNGVCIESDLCSGH